MGAIEIVDGGWCAAQNGTYLHHAHIESRVMAQLFPYVSRGFGRIVVGYLESFQLLCSDGCSRSLR